MGNLSQRMSAKAGGMADVSASLVGALYQQGADVHVALPNYRRMFNLSVANLFNNEFEIVSEAIPEKRIHLAQDRVFFHQSSVYGGENHLLALAFQREVINHIIPRVRPDLIHCNDWMTGLIPAVAKRHEIRSLFTVHNIHTERLSLAEIEDRGIDAADFWQHLFYSRPPGNYEETRSHNPVDLLTSGIFASHFVNTVSPTFLSEVVDGRHDFIPGQIRHELWSKCNAGCASGILNAPDQSFDPETDTYLNHHYDAGSLAEGKRSNKIELQKRLGLTPNPDAPLLYWPSRLDPVQKGCHLLTNILYQTCADYATEGLQFAVIASGAFQDHFHHIVGMHGLHDRVAVCDFKEDLSHIAYAAADGIIMPSSFEPCGLPQMVAPMYGTLPLAHDTGGIHDTVEPLDVANNKGNGFLFQIFDSQGLRWTIDQMMQFLRLPAKRRNTQLARIMREASKRFCHEATAKAYIELYQKMLGRPISGG
jgi:ADP-glucose type glycogen/starch synthase